MAYTSTPSQFQSGVMWRRGRNSWLAEICVMSGNPLSERSELWISTNAFSRFPQALEFRPTATESLAESGWSASSKPPIIIYTKSPGHVYTVYTPGLSYIFIKLVFQRLSAHLLQQLRFNLIKLIRKVHINLMRVHETFGLIPEGVLLLRADITDFHNGR